MKEKIRALIVDDQPKDRRRMRRLLSADPEIEIIGECANGRDAIKAIQTLNPHLVFLDIVMPQIDGFAVLEAIDKKKLPLVVFVTIREDYARRAFDVHAVDYLYKPYDDSRFQEAIREAKHRLRTKPDEITASILAMLEDLKNPLPVKTNYVKRLSVVDKAGRISPIRVTDINWIRAEDKYVRLHVGGESYLLRAAISNLETQLDPEQFLRIDRSHIVNIDRIASFTPMSRKKGEVVFRDKAMLETSETGTECLRKTLGHRL